MPLVTLSQKELHRLEAIQKIRDRRLSVVQAAELCHLSRSQVHRLAEAEERYERYYAMLDAPAMAA